MEDDKLRELSKDFLLKNVVCTAMSIDGGEMEHKFKNGRTRIIDIFKQSVKIIDKDGNLLYHNKLDKKHPLMFNAINYYKLAWVPRKPIITEAAKRRFKRERDSYKIDCEEFYKVIEFNKF